MIKKLHFLRIALFISLGLISISGQLSAQCNAGVLQTTGSVDVPLGMTFDFMVTNDTIPAGGGYGIILDNTNTNGVGGTGGAIIASNILPTDMVDSDVNGLLSANNLDLLVGTWVVFGAVYSDPAAPGQTICSITTDSLIVTFEGEVSTECIAGDLEIIGTTIVCPGDSFDVVVINEVIPTGGGNGWLFLSGTTGTGANDAEFLLTGITGMETYDAGLNGILAANNLPDCAGTWIIKAATYSSSAAGQAFASICSISEDSLMVLFNPELTASIVNNENTSVTIAPVGGTSPYTFMWSNGETTQTATDLTDGNLMCTVIDANGCEVSEGIDLMNTAVEDIEGLLNFELNPNPTSGFAQLELNFDEAQSVKINILGMDGKILQTVINERTVGGVYNLDMTAYTTGVYLVHITTESGHFAERLFVR